MDRASVGAALLWLGGVGAVTLATAGWLRRPRLARLARIVVVLATGGAAITLGSGLIDLDFQVVAVADSTTAATSWPYRLAGLWSGMSGSLLFWTAGLAVVALLAARASTDRDRQATVDVVFGLYLAVMFAGLLGPARPFARLAIPAVDGGGLTPVLLHPAMLYHPPLLYAGALTVAVPFAMTMAALRARLLDDRWARSVHRWALASWTLLTIGMVAGAHWAAAELGWGGFWSWDPIENGILLPWLLLTAFLHAGDRSPRMRASLVVAAFVAGGLGAWLTRSGATQSVHSFAEARAVGWLLLAALMATVAVSVGWLVTRAPRAAQRDSGAWRGAPTVELLVAIAVLVAIGTLFPLARSERGQVSGRWFATVTVLPAIALAIVLGIRAARSFRSPAAAIAHAGVALLVIGIAGSVIGSERTAVVAPGGHIRLGGYDFDYIGARTARARDGGAELEARFRLRRAGNRQQLEVLRPRLRVAPDRGGVVSVMALRSTPLADEMVVLRRVLDADGSIVATVSVVPLRQAVWGGGLALALGGVTALSRRRRPRSRRHSPPLSAAEASPPAAVGPRAGGRSSEAEPEGVAHRAAPTEDAVAAADHLGPGG